ncbi:MAG TPA: hypothetical protein VIK53_01210 [Verrucomicrobiae bacterium]
MRKSSAGFISTLSLVALLASWLAAVQAGFAAGTTNLPAAETYDYATPALLTGTLYEIGSDRKHTLYTFRRTATRSGSTVNVRRQFLGTNGSVAAEEDVVYESGRLVSFQMKEFQEQVSGAIQIVPDPKNPGQQKLIIGFGHGLTPPKGVTGNLLPDTVTDDTVYPFMMDHWNDLMQGRAVRFRFISLEHERTFEFRLVKTAETVRAGRTVEQIKMEPVNFFVSELINPLVFNVEKDGSHRILSYIGRTTPRIKKGKAWKYLDAETVFDWK